jgi:hypothetical protein
MIARFDVTDGMRTALGKMRQVVTEEAELHSWPIREAVDD